jgi:hypothetical protein
MDTVFPPYSQVINGKDNGRRLTNTSSDSNSFLNYSCIEIGYSFQTNLIPLVKTQSINKFRTDLDGARPVIFLVAIGAGIVILGALVILLLLGS